MSWSQFLKLHWDVLAATDFFTVEVATWHGLVTYYVLVVMEVATGRVQIAGITSDQFLDWNVFSRFQSTVATLNDNWMPEDIRVFSVSEDGQSDKHSLNVSFFVVQGERPIE